MKKFSLKNTLGLLAAAAILTLSSAEAFAGNEDDGKPIHLTYALGSARVDIDFLSINDLNDQENLTLDNVKPAEFNLTRDMTVNGVHIKKGEYEVTLIKHSDGLALNFDAQNKHVDTKVIALSEKDGEFTNWLNYSLKATDASKVVGEINWKAKTYTFEMEVSLTNYIFSYLDKAVRENNVEWIDYYQAGIYAFKYNIDLKNSVKYAEKALKADKNQYTEELVALYQNALASKEKPKNIAFK